MKTMLWAAGEISAVIGGSDGPTAIFVAVKVADDTVSLLVKAGVILAFCLLFWAGCYKGTGSDEKNLKSFHSYPVKVQELVRAQNKLNGKVPKQVSIPRTLLANILVFAVLFFVIGLILQFTVGFRSVGEVFVYFFLFGEILNLFDLVVIDLLWWRNTKRIRFSFAMEKELYQDPKKHVDSFLRGIPTFAVVALIVAGIFVLIL